MLHKAHACLPDCASWASPLTFLSFSFLLGERGHQVPPCLSPRGFKSCVLFYPVKVNYDSERGDLGKRSKSPASWQEQAFPQVALTSLLSLSRHQREQTFRLLAT